MTIKSSRYTRLEKLYNLLINSLKEYKGEDIEKIVCETEEDLIQAILKIPNDIIKSEGIDSLLNYLFEEEFSKYDLFSLKRFSKEDIPLFEQSNEKLKKHNIEISETFEDIDIKDYQDFENMALVSPLEHIYKEDVDIFFEIHAVGGDWQEPENIIFAIVNDKIVFRILKGKSMLNGSNYARIVDILLGYQAPPNYIEEIYDTIFQNNSDIESIPKDVVNKVLEETGIDLKVNIFIDHNIEYIKKDIEETLDKLIQEFKK